jgi:hypothetical protein
MIFMPKQYPRDLGERAVRLVAEHRGEYANLPEGYRIYSDVASARRRSAANAGRCSVAVVCKTARSINQ